MNEGIHPACEHDWQPIPGWYARYRCARCRAIGCKFGVVCPAVAHRSVEIRPYRCEAVRGGEKCNAPAVQGKPARKLRCAEHAHLGGRTGLARKAHDALNPSLPTASPDPESRSDDFALSKSGGRVPATADAGRPSQ